MKDKLEWLLKLVHNVNWEVEKLRCGLQKGEINKNEAVKVLSKIQIEHLNYADTKNLDASLYSYFKNYSVE